MKTQESKRKTSAIEAVDLFCGVGGLTHGLALGGIMVRAGIDLDPICRFPYEANNSATFIEEDVKNLSADTVKRLFKGKQLRLLAGCAPCQPFSTYSRGGRRGGSNKDWELVVSFGRLIREVQPDLVTMENVPQMEQHPVFQKFLKDLEGYHVAWSVIECSAIGVPQTRKRFVLLASKLGPEGLSIPTSHYRQVTVRDAIGHLPSVSAGEAHANDPMHAAPRLSAINMERIQASRPGGTWRDWHPSLRAACHQRETGDTYPSVYGRMSWDQPGPTMTTQCFGYGNGRFGHPEQDRAITLREAAVLQTFPAKYRFLRKGERATFYLLGRLIGNAVPVRLGEVIAEVLRSHVALYGQRRRAG
ncbi:DNA cytosine methyltransferase [Rhodanobacter sp. MP1X3]|uniref:DNA cytosine methyltransferase n=1 Tax=Rhodanobacter sp. MP1X3 TaxID=2723086 RepID=UPI00161694EE|nr:DNA cytosine methyltransferase [Rhodanobacter sp. MP1X3]MBB6242411.1 DNA (cytosine-5)-methyltransferase 1 [Rhodanobacter sp. MP1X3]